MHESSREAADRTQEIADKASQKAREMNIPTSVEDAKEAASKGVQKAKEMAPSKETMKQTAD